MNIYFWLINIISNLILYIFSKKKFTLEKQIEYNNFADKRIMTCCMCKINNFNDVFSNTIYTIAGLYQIYRGYYYLGYSCILVSIGSSYYHLKPNMNTLFYDRLPMQIAFSYIICEKIDLNIYEQILINFISYGSLIYWKLTYDLIPYASFQLSMILYWLFFDNLMLIPVLMYISAKIFEDNDLKIFNITNKNVSGHTLKHIISGLAIFFIN